MHTFEVAGNGVEQDPEAVWRAVVDGSRDALHASGVSAEDVVAVICDSHFFSLVCLGRDGKPTTNIMPWADRRATHARLARFPGYRPDSWWRQFQWWRIHGIPPMRSGMENISRMRWVKYARPDVYERTAVFLEPMDYIAYRLTGRATATACTAFPLQLTDNRSLGHTRYSPTLYRYAGIDAEKLPELLPVDAVIGSFLPEVATELGLSPRAQVVTGLNDTQAREGRQEVRHLPQRRGRGREQFGAAAGTRPAGGAARAGRRGSRGARRGQCRNGHLRRCGNAHPGGPLPGLAGAPASRLPVVGDARRAAAVRRIALRHQGRLRRQVRVLTT